MAIAKCTSVGIRLTTGNVIPVIRAVVTDAFEYTTAEKVALAQDFSNKAGGILSVCSYQIRQTSSIFDSLISSGSHTYGDDSGFRLVVSRSGAYYRQFRVSLYFQGTLVGYAAAFTGYDYSTCPLIIYTDSEYHILSRTPATDNEASFEWIGYAGETNITDRVSYLEQPGCLVTTWDSQLSLNTAYATARAIHFQIGADIHDYISGEIDPSKTDPYEEDNPTTTGGGEGIGTDNIPQDNITIPAIPAYGYANTGFFSIWIPSEEEIKALAAFMWNADVHSIDFWKRLIGDPIELIIGLSVVPFDITPTGREAVSLGLVNTGVQMAYTEQQYYDIPCGEITVPEIWGAYLDYNPYTKLEIFLPYIGTRALNADEVVGRTIRLTYRVDIVSGSCVAMIECIKDDTSMLLYHFSGSCAVPVPVTSMQFRGIIEKTLGLVGASVAAVATGGAAIPVVGAVSSAISLAATKQTIQRSGSLGSAAGLLDSQIPYVIFTRPNKAIPDEQNVYTGYPSFITETLGDLSGYTEVEVLHLNQIPATEAELREIDSLLKAGVIF